MAKHKIKPRAFIKAVQGTGGILSKIALKLNVDRNTVYSFLADNPEMQLYVDQETEVILDLAEDGLFGSVKQKDPDAIKWILARKGKKRGYGDSLAISKEKEKTDEQEVEDRLAKLNETNQTTAD